MERRKSPRIGLGIPIQLNIHQYRLEGAYRGQNIEGTLIDLSGSGVQIQSPIPLAEEMFMVIQMPEESGISPMNARIIRAEASEDMGQYQYGCMLSAVSLFQQQQLEAYILQYRGGKRE